MNGKQLKFKLNNKEIKFLNSIDNNWIFYDVDRIKQMLNGCDNKKAKSILNKIEQIGEDNDNCCK